MAAPVSPDASPGQMFAGLLASLLLVALATTLVLPDRQTPKVVKNLFDGLSGAVRAVLGNR